MRRYCVWYGRVSNCWLIRCSPYLKSEDGFGPWMNKLGYRSFKTFEELQSALNRPTLPEGVI